ncbi:MAG: hypothetical protein ACODTL_00030 [Brucella sp.]|uniref:Uncharacterized protein n=2 Tax=Pigmentiphaga TaxID=152267 RepID=A0ABN1D2Y7_9BURK|nr:hypothetical protein [Pigmentiphaga sp. D-2]
MEVAIAHPDQLIHVRTVLGVVMGLSVARLLTGLARLIQHPGRVRLYPTHLIWAAFLFLGVVYFWWFEFGLQHVAQWSFELYFFLIFYAALFFLQCTLLFPDHMEEYSGFEAYFHSRQKWFYGLLAALAIVDVMDTLWKGIEHFHAIGHWGSVAKIVKLEHAWRRLDGRNDDGFQVAPFPG